MNLPESMPRALLHMAVNSKRDLPWFAGGPPHKGEMIIAAGGPSLTPRIDVIKSRQRDGATVLAVNGVARHLRQAGVKPDIVLFVDPSPEVAGFIDEEPDESLYLVASICDPAVFEKLEGREVFVWHPELGGLQDQQQAIFELHPDKPCSLIGGGNTAALRAFNLGFVLGYRSFHAYGLDSSYIRGEADHAYPKGEGHEPEGVSVQLDGKFYWCSPWMIRQAEEFKFAYAQLRGLGCKIAVHGTGLIPDIAKSLKKLERSFHVSNTTH